MLFDHNQHDIAITIRYGLSNIFIDSQQESTLISWINAANFNWIKTYFKGIFYGHQTYYMMRMEMCQMKPTDSSHQKHMHKD